MIDVLLQVLLGAAVLAGTARVLRPGQLADRVISFDVTVLALVGLIATAAVRDGLDWILKALPVIGLLAVVATVTFAYAVGRRS